MQTRSNALAHALSDEGLGEGDGVAIMCRNHRGFIDATLAVAKIGAHALYLNTAFAAPQLSGVVENEEPAAIIYDEEFRELLGEALECDEGEEMKRYVAWSDSDEEDAPAQAATGDVPDTALEDLIASGDASDLNPPPESEARFVILTSGTTGTPKGAQRSAPALAGAARRDVLADPAEGRGADDDRRAPLPQLGHGALPARASRCARPSSCGGSSTRRRPCARPPRAARPRSSSSR